MPFMEVAFRSAKVALRGASFAERKATIFPEPPSFQIMKTLDLEPTELRSRCQSMVAKRRAVTLIEAIAVILILSASAAASMIYLDHDFLSRRHAIAATNQVGDVFMLARNTAVSHQTKVQVTRVQERGTLQIVIRQEAGPIEDERTWKFDLPEGTKIDGSTSTLVFQPIGSANRDLKWNVHHGDTYGTVAIAPVSGKVTWSTP